jgi:hypothetical protein
MSIRYALKTALFTGLTALPLFLFVGCSESTSADDENDPITLQSSKNRDLAEVTVANDELPLDDCSKANSKKVLVCHVPPENPGSAHTICVSEYAATNGHELNLADPYQVGGHGGDRLGACEVLDAAATGVSETEGG